MSIHLESKDLLNTQQMEVAINGPDGATHLILCTGVAHFGPISHETYTFFVGPQLSRRQFVVAIVSGALAGIQGTDLNSISSSTPVKLEASLASIDANYDDETGQVKVRAEVVSSVAIMNLSISYYVSILAELSIL